MELEVEPQNTAPAKARWSPVVHKQRWRFPPRTGHSAGGPAHLCNCDCKWCKNPGVWFKGRRKKLRLLWRLYRRARFVQLPRSSGTILSQAIFATAKRAKPAPDLPEGWVAVTHGDPWYYWHRPSNKVQWHLPMTVERWNGESRLAQVVDGRVVAFFCRDVGRTVTTDLSDGLHLPQDTCACKTTVILRRKEDLQSEMAFGLWDGPETKTRYNQHSLRVGTLAASLPGLVKASMQSLLVTSEATAALANWIWPDVLPPGWVRVRVPYEALLACLPSATCTIEFSLRSLSHNDVYYWNVETNEVTWDKPV
ncbi:hypothetical protein AK812_SmicGene33878 [Symbiodinium microadriaticum]|uniref:WW domain-containing protein n=1 Tax=Symbiodinium microadriaticum TaxID=2951 RepID=A0A1Q9CQH2_SYMMI|nr:hypothetical protein AK812_SmicGene33878 [Symbiodinium microadriaticum]